MNLINFGAQVGLQAKPNLFIKDTNNAKFIIKKYRNPKNLNNLFIELDNAIKHALHDENHTHDKKQLTTDEIIAPQALYYLLVGCPADEFVAVQNGALTIIQKYNHKLRSFFKQNPKVDFNMKFYEYVLIKFETGQAASSLLYFMHNQATALVGESSPTRIEKYDKNIIDIMHKEPFMKWMLSNIDHPKLSDCSAAKLIMVAIRMTDFLINPGGQLQSSGLPMTKKQRSDATGKLEWHAAYSGFCYM